MIINQTIKEFAKEMYLTPDNVGNHKYTLRQIALAIKEKFNVDVSFVTVQSWTKKYGWDRLWEEAVKRGITEAIHEQTAKNLEEVKTMDEQFKEAIAQKKKEDFILATNLKRQGYMFIKEHGFTSTMEALKAIETGLKYTQDLAGNENQTIRIEVSSEEVREMIDKILEGERTEEE